VRCFVTEEVHPPLADFSPRVEARPPPGAVKLAIHCFPSSTLLEAIHALRAAAADALPRDAPGAAGRLGPLLRPGGASAVPLWSCRLVYPDRSGTFVMEDAGVVDLREAGGAAGSRTLAELKLEAGDFLSFALLSLKVAPPLQVEGRPRAARVTMAKDRSAPASTLCNAYPSRSGSRT